MKEKDFPTAIALSDNSFAMRAHEKYSDMYLRYVSNYCDRIDFEKCAGKPSLLLESAVNLAKHNFRDRLYSDSSFMPSFIPGVTSGSAIAEKLAKAFDELPYDKDHYVKNGWKCDVQIYESGQLYLFPTKVPGLFVKSGYYGHDVEVVFLDATKIEKNKKLHRVIDMHSNLPDKDKFNNKGKKYEFTGHTKIVDGHVLNEIRARFPFHNLIDIRAGQLGGWIESEKNLSQKGDAWITQDSCIYGNAVVSGNAFIYNDSVIKDNAVIKGGNFEKCLVCDNAVIDKVDAEQTTFKDSAKVSCHEVNNSVVSGNAQLLGDNTEVNDSTITDNVIVKDSSIYKCKISGDYKIENQDFFGRNLTSNVSKDCAVAIEISDKSKIMKDIFTNDKINTFNTTDAVHWQNELIYHTSDKYAGVATKALVNEAEKIVKEAKNDVSRALGLIDKLPYDKDHFVENGWKLSGKIYGDDQTDYDVGVQRFELYPTKIPGMFVRNFEALEVNYKNLDIVFVDATKLEKSAKLRTVIDIRDNLPDKNIVKTKSLKPKANKKSKNKENVNDER